MQIHKIKFKNCFLLLTCSLFLISCTSKKKSTLQTILREDSINTDSIFETETNSNIWTLNCEYFSPVLTDTASKWLQLTQRIIKQTRFTNNRIEEFKKGFNNNYDYSNAKEVFEWLENYKHEVLNINDELKEHFLGEKIFKFYGNSTKNFVDSFVNNHSRESILNILTSFQNQIISNQYSLVNYCKKRCDIFYDPGYSYSIITIPNAIHFNSGDELILKSFIIEEQDMLVNCKPHIYLEGKEVGNYFEYPTHLNKDKDEYRIKVDGTRGRHILEVKYVYPMPDGSNVSKTEELEYFIDK